MNTFVLEIFSLDSQSWNYVKVLNNERVPARRYRLTRIESEATRMSRSECMEVAKVMKLPASSVNIYDPSDVNDNESEREHYEQLNRQLKATGRIY